MTHDEIRAWYKANGYNDAAQAIASEPWNFDAEKISASIGWYERGKAIHPRKTYVFRRGNKYFVKNFL